jgi:hypothetical protein
MSSGSPEEGAILPFNKGEVSNYLYSMGVTPMLVKAQLDAAQKRASFQDVLKCSALRRPLDGYQCQ